METDSKRSSSLKSKFWLLGLLIGGSAALTAIVAGLTISRMNQAQQQYQQAIEMAEQVGHLKTQFISMEAAEYGFIADPANEGLWDKRIKANESIKELVKAIKEKPINPEIREFIEKAAEINEKTLTPASQEAKDTIGKDRMGVLKLYALKVTPGYGLARLKIEKAVNSYGEEETTARDHLNKAVTVGSMAVAGVLILGLIFSIITILKVGKSIISPLQLAVEHLTQEAHDTTEAASHISTASKTLQENTTVQATAIEETSASIEELNAMTQKNAENAAKSGATAGQSHESAMRGKHAMTEMFEAIQDISKSNGQIVLRIEENNKQFSEIIQVIGEIGNKTKVINDIVFQTKLLSFNASVEAARAGEQGKGFAVVAEEVGNLAQMSGNAAKEISAMLEAGIQKVESIVNQSQSMVKSLMADAKVKLDRGTEVAQDSSKVLDEIVARVSEVNLMVNEISTATAEQANGIQEITNTMSQINKAMNENSGISQQIGEYSNQLHRQSESLNSVVSSLAQLTSKNS